MPVLKSDGSQGLDEDFVPTDPHHLVPLWFVEEIAALRTLPTINTSTLPAAEVGVDYDELISVTGVPTPIPSTPTAPPSGLQLDQDWHVRGKPLTGGDYVWVARGSNGLGTPFDRTFNHRVNQRPMPITVALPDAVPTASYLTRIDWVAFPAASASVVVGSLPPDYTLTNHGTYAEISGTNDFVGVTAFTVRIANTVDFVDVPLSITSGTLSPPGIVDDAFPPALVNVLSSFQLTLTGNPLPSVWADGGPVGFQLLADGSGSVLSAVAGTWDIEVHAGSLVGGEIIKVLQLVINEATAAPAWVSPAAGTLTAVLINTATRLNLVATGSPPAVFVLKSGTLNPGCSIDNTTTPPALVLYPTQAGAGTAFELEANNGIAPAATRTFTQPVNQPAFLVQQTLNPATTGAAGSQQLTVGGYPTGGIVTKLSGPSQLSCTGAGLLLWTTAPAIGNYDVSLSVDNGVGAATIYSYVWQVVASSSAWTPPAGFYGYFYEGRGMTFSSGVNVQQWADPVAGININATAGQEPIDDAANKLIAFTDSPLRSLGNDSLDLAIPFCIALRVRPKATTITDTLRQLLHGNNKWLYFFNAAAAGQDKFQFTAGGVAMSGPLGTHTDAWHSVLIWLTSTSAGGIRHGATEAISSSIATTSGFLNFRINGGSTPLDADVRAVAFYTDSTKFDDATKRGNIIAAMDASDSGTAPPPPSPLTVIADGDARMTDLGHSALALSAHSNTMQYHMGSTQPLPGLQHGWIGYVNQLTDPIGAKATASIYGISKVIKNGSPMIRHYANNQCPPGYGNSRRARLRGMKTIKFRTSAIAHTPDTVWLAARIILAQSMITTDKRQLIFETSHAVNASTTPGTNPFNGPSVSVGRSGYGNSLSMPFIICRANTPNLNDGNNTPEVMWTAPNGGPVAEVPYDFVAHMRYSYRDSTNGYTDGDAITQLWVRSPAHYGGHPTQIVNDFKRNFINDSGGSTAGLGVEIYAWFPFYGQPNAPSYASPLVTEHELWSSGVLSAYDLPGTPTLSHLVMFAKIDQVLGL